MSFAFAAERHPHPSFPVVKDNVEFWPIRTLHGVQPVLGQVDVAARLGRLLDLARHLLDDPRHFLGFTAATIVGAAGWLMSGVVRFQVININNNSNS